MKSLDESIALQQRKGREQGADLVRAAQQALEQLNSIINDPNFGNTFPEDLRNRFRGVRDDVRRYLDRVRL